MDNKRKPFDVTRVLAAHRIADIQEKLERLAAQIAEADQAKANVALTYQELARAHGLRLPAPADLRPRVDWDHERRARRYRLGGRAAHAIGILLFAAFGAASLNVDAPVAVVFAGFLVVGTLFCIMVAAILAMVTKANARNPGAEPTLRRIAAISGAAAGVSAAALLCSRFVDDGPLVALIPPLLVLLEISLVVMGASLEAAHSIYTWSSVLEKQYTALCAEHDRLAQEHSAATAELEQLQTASSSNAPEEENEKTNAHTTVNGSAAASVHLERRASLNN